MLRFARQKQQKKNFKVQKKTKKNNKNQNVDANNNITISKLVETKNDFKHWIVYLDQVIRPLILILSK